MNKRASGILCHPTSMPSKFGIGDLGNGAFDFIDFLYEAGQTLWQILPIGPTSFGDSPYQSFSSFAGNTLLISPEKLVNDGLLTHDDLNTEISFDDRTVDYGKVIKFKNTLFKKAFTNFNKNTSEFIKFCDENKLWLDDFSLFISLKNYFINKRKHETDKTEYELFKTSYSKTLGENLLDDYYYGAVWTTWNDDIASHNKNAVKKYTKQLEHEILYSKFLQYLFYKQWSDLKSYANKKDIKIIGDLPIFTAFDSCDVWSNQSIFMLDSKGYPLSVAGVPPDYFSNTGQLWGNPLYDWEANEKTNYDWWINRIQSNLNNVDILRIDHFRGFDTYWEIPFGSENAIGGTWKDGPKDKLFIALDKKLGKLPIIAEDLGELSPEVHVLREKFNLPGMKILQFAFGDNSGNEYLPHNFTDTNAIIYTGTHDNNTSIGWYNDATEQEKDHLRTYLNISGNDVAWDLIRLAFSSVAKCAIIPLQDIMSLDSSYRMNTPGVPSGNWKFRYTEDMLKHEYRIGLRYLSDLYYRNIKEPKQQ